MLRAKGMAIIDGDGDLFNFLTAWPCAATSLKGGDTVKNHTGEYFAILSGYFLQGWEREKERAVQYSCIICMGRTQHCSKENILPVQEFLLVQQYI